MKERPNIILIITDQQRYDTIAALGYSFMETPHLDRLVNEGVSFDQCYVTAPSCAPSRASLFTGYYPHTTGIYKNADVWQHSWIEDLSASGYHCVNVGKMHTYPFETPMGFDERFVVENKDRYLEGRYFFDRWDMSLQAQGLVKQQREWYRKREDYDESLGAFEWQLPAHTQSDMFVGDLAKWWIEQKPLNAPLFMQIGFPGPHPPFDPIESYATPYLNKELPLPEVSTKELEEQPHALKELIKHNCEIDHDSVSWSQNPTKEQLHRMRAYYYANITMIDEKIGGIIQALEEKKMLDNTIIIFMSDHGESLGDHGHIQKWNMYDVVTRVPMIVWGPSQFQGGRRIDELCQHFDIAPVIMELAGLDVPASWQTQTLMPFLKGETDGGREFVFSEHPYDGILTGTEQMTMIRSKAWKLVHYVDHEDGELYDLVNDSQEKQNLWYQTDYQEQKTILLNELLAWSIRSQLKSANWSIPWR